MRATWRVFLLAALIAFAWSSCAFAFDSVTNLIDKKVQLAGFGVHEGNKPGEFMCVIHVGTDLADQGTKALVDLADQVFEEVFGAECWRYAYQSKTDGKIYISSKCVVYVGKAWPDYLMSSKYQDQYRRSLVDGTSTDLSVEYALLGPNDFPDKEAATRGRSGQYDRVTQLNVPVEASHREPNLAAIQTEIEPGVSIALENKADLVYTGYEKPNLFITYQTAIPYEDRAASRALAEKIVAKFAADRLARHELQGVTLAAYNEPRRGRFHFRRGYRYDTDEDGKSLREN